MTKQYDYCVYRDYLISTIVDCNKDFGIKIEVYRDYLISTIVDLLSEHYSSQVYRDYLISTIVDHDENC